MISFKSKRPGDKRRGVVTELLQIFEVVKCMDDHVDKTTYTVIGGVTIMGHKNFMCTIMWKIESLVVNSSKQ